MIILGPIIHDLYTVPFALKFRQQRPKIFIICMTRIYTRHTTVLTPHALSSHLYMYIYSLYKYQQLYKNIYV